MYKAISHSVQVQVKPDYQRHYSKAERSPYQGKHVWLYEVEICNLSQHDIQLRRRYWHIIDGQGRVQEVSGRGVVGEEPVIAAGDCYRYSSGCPLQSESGIMSGYYEMEDEQGRYFKVEIPAFSLDLPNQAKVIN
ncbi:MAG: Co2+/Mg2+ efflux protein ApaG [Cohaesibacter sp.]|nr:Co2+/Mg2+ efflux protein ApaG [Cohaesibacter sp.]MCV6601739.1 Co2+/Mg2+ efflux protein ApaG [Cohaesibacter sp.]